MNIPPHHQTKGASPPNTPLYRAYSPSQYYTIFFLKKQCRSRMQSPISEIFLRNSSSTAQYIDHTKIFDIFHS
ncbi:hypothetical protein HMPREF9163_00260 [Selenomonas sp. oral taxon 138 str. F0429]|nr:hypothetical protein HMPREF9163_00260 [Selenomonas sp. oral taxon 138 str. F0429]